VKYELDFYIPGDDIHHSHRRENLKSFIRILLAPTLAQNKFVQAINFGESVTSRKTVSSVYTFQALAMYEAKSACIWRPVNTELRGGFKLGRSYASNSTPAFSVHFGTGRVSSEICTSHRTLATPDVRVGQHEVLGPWK
jgi:hypothetical protein